ncbi:hypothetical protein BO86DRAFT_374820 [Aspergillus japonicus CBS 114.51]|uniref:Uncharacterized protein n=2 Tax=Aspergillus TaxID=5052 RepID=A0A2V5H3U2_ASPV1|nr:hypothetical protein BO86DRAFT_374820 [Aspergillus japonicus CBS 114.51]PYI18678.1 hypothetical protein BO99DRAFT_433407 [Aspergillus violaceofuscus CBS 115571]RAH86842.1 hypothetical protein BO86DRAFT_374820 [Aspergillus japonicus CBS 114.51]
MKTSTILAILGAASCAVAIRCTQGMTYCGTSLVKKGNYAQDMQTALQREGIAPTSHQLLDSLYLCTADEDYLIYRTTCRRGACQDNGVSRDDTCIGTEEQPQEQNRDQNQEQDVGLGQDQGGQNAGPYTTVTF